MNPSHAHRDLSSSDALAGEAFDRILSSVEDGRVPEPEECLVDCPHLRPKFDEMLELAQAIAIGPKTREPATPIAGFEIESDLGRGGMGAVYLARQLNAGGRPVALKVLPTSHAGAAARERFRREALAIARLTHPNIVKVYDTVLAGGEFAYAMEFVDGATLHRIIDAVAVEPRRALEVVREILPEAASERHATYPKLVAAWGFAIADALHSVHAAGLLHRDVKPSNVLIRRAGTALLSDFGLVHEAAGHTITVSGAFAGTAAYASPEQLRGGFHELDVRSDIYSLGATLFHALALGRPFEAASIVQILRAIESDGAPKLSARPIEVPDDLARIVRKAMAPDPGQRYPSAAEMAADLQRFLDQRPIHARPATWTYQARTYLRRHRWAAMAGIGAGLAATILAGAMSVRVFLFPRWREAAIREARIGIVRASSTDRLFNFAFFDYATRPSLSDEARHRFSNVINEYDRAVLFADRSGAATVEREAVRLLRDTLEEIQEMQADSRSRVQEPGPGTSEPRPNVALRYARAFVRELASTPLDQPVVFRNPTSLESEALERESSSDLRQLGLIAYGLGDIATSTRAWGIVEARGEEDYLSSGLLGILYLIENSPALAYPRLRTAMIDFPDAIEFTMFTAEAALGVGDYSKAKHYLKSATRSPIHDRRAAFRIGALIDIAEGRVEEVLRRVRELERDRDEIKTSVLCFQIATRLQQLKRSDLEIVEFATFGAGGSIAAPRAKALFRDVALRWWENAPQPERFDLVLRLLRPEDPRRGNWRDAFMLLVGLHLSTSRSPSDSPPVGQNLTAIANRWYDHLGAYIESLWPSGQWTLPTQISDARVREVATWMLTGEGPPPQLMAEFGGPLGVTKPGI